MTLVQLAKFTCIARKDVACGKFTSPASRFVMLAFAEADVFHANKSSRMLFHENRTHSVKL